MPARIWNLRRNTASPTPCWCPRDLEAALRQHPAVADAAVVGVPSERWGETPVAFVVVHDAATSSAAELLQWANARLGKTQRLADLQLRSALPRSAIGKVLKRELRTAYGPTSSNNGTASP